MILYILRGVPGAGKSTLAKELAPTENICEADSYQLDKDGNYVFNPRKVGICHKLCMDKFKRLVHEHTDRIVVSNTSTKLREFKAYMDYATENGYKVIVIVVENRHGNDSVHDVPQETREKMAENLLGSIKLI